jgi:GNAT superfamily N-acetyltransferase
MTIRPVQTDDAPFVATLLAELGYPSTPEEVARRIGALEDSDAVLIADAGLIALHRVPRLAEGGAFARITALVVGSQRRREGVAQSLLDAAEDVARRWDCDLLEVSSGRRPERSPAHAFYLAAGFEDAAPSSTRYWKRIGGARRGSPS